MTDFRLTSPAAARLASVEPWFLSRWPTLLARLAELSPSRLLSTGAARSLLVKGTVFSILSALVLGFMVMPSRPANAQFTEIVNFFTPSTPNDVQKKYDDNLAALQSSAAGCWGCTVFDNFASAVFKTGAQVSSGGNATALAGVITAVASLFALVYIGGAFVSGDASDLLSRWKVFWQLMIAVAIGTAWLTTNGGAFDNTWRYIYGPLMKIPLATANAVTGGVSGDCGGAPSVADTPPGGGEILGKMRDVVCGGHKITMKGIAFGIALGGSGDGIVGSLLNLAVGFSCIIIFGWVAISFPLRFIDILIRLTIVGVVTPILVVCATFKPTRSYIQIGISNVLYAGASFAVTSIMFKLGSDFFDKAINDRIGSVGTWKGGTMIADSVVVVAIAVIFASMLKMAPSIASEFSQFRGSAGSPVGDSAANFASTVTTLPVKAAGAAIAVKTGGAMAGRAMAASGGGGGGLGRRMSTPSD